MKFLFQTNSLMKKVFSILCLLSVIAFTSVSAENKGSPVGTENAISQYSEVPAIANIETISFDAVTGDNVICSELICQVNESAQIVITVDSGQGYKCPSTENSDSNYDGTSATKSGGLFKPGTNSFRESKIGCV